MAEQAKPSVSVIIVSYNTRGFLRRCLESLRQHGSELVREIIVIDNASGDGSVEMIEEDFPEVKLVRNPTNVGYAKAVNRGVKLAEGDYFLILNPDIEVLEEAVGELVSFMEEHRDVGIAGAKLLNPDGSLQMSCRTFYTLPVVLLRRTFLGKIFPNAAVVRRHLMADWDHACDREVDWVIGACLMVRREAYESVGGMDERFFLYFEDVDWCYRMKKHGWKVYYVHSAQMKHHHRRESARLLPDSKLLSHLLSTFRFYDKWSSLVYSLKQHRHIIGTLSVILSDVIAINTSFLLSYFIRYLMRSHFEKPLYPVTTYTGFIVFVNLLCLFSFVYSGLYSSRRRTNFVKDLIVVSRAVLLSSLVIMAATYLTRTIAYSRFIVFIFWPICAVAVATLRAILRQFHLRLRRRFFDLRRVAVVGEDADALEMGKRIGAMSDRFDFVGYILPPKVKSQERLHPNLGFSGRVGSIVVEHRLNELVICDSNLSRQDVGSIISEARKHGAEVKVVSEITDLVVRGSQIDTLAGKPIVIFPPSSLSGVSHATKRLMDWLAALVATIGLAVVTPLVVVWQLVSWRNFGPLISAFGSLVQVLKGKRSLVGPHESVPGERLKPGIIGLWYVKTQEGEIAQKQIDSYYVQNWSLTADLEIMLSSLGALSRLFARSHGKDRKVEES